MELYRWRVINFLINLEHFVHTFDKLALENWSNYLCLIGLLKNLRIDRSLRPNGFILLNVLLGLPELKLGIRVKI